MLLANETLQVGTTNGFAFQFFVMKHPRKCHAMQCTAYTNVQIGVEIGYDCDHRVHQSNPSLFLCNLTLIHIADPVFLTRISADADEALIGHMFTVARDLARSAGIADSGYRLIINCNRDGGQEVFHLHVHLVGGAPLGPMLAH